MPAELREQLVWPLALRIVHWTLALTVVLLLTTGWLIGSGLVPDEQLYQFLRRDLHVPAGQIAALAVIGRILLLFLDRGAAGWRALVPRRSSTPAVAEMFRFYLSWGRRRPPAYFGHDPFWALVYPAFLLLIVVQVAGGLALEIDGLRQISGLSANALSVWHQAGAGLLFWVVVLHVLSVLLREVRTKSWDISAMIQGYRVFRVERQGESGRQSQASVSVAEIINRREKG